MQCYDVITNARWRTAANMKIVMSAYFRDSDMIMIKFDSLTQIYFDKHGMNKIQF